MVICVILGIVGTLLLGIGAACCGYDSDSKGGGMTLLIGVILLAIALGALNWLPGTPVKDLGPGTYSVVTADLDLTEKIKDKDKIYSVEDEKAIHMIIWLGNKWLSFERNIEMRYIRLNKEAFARPELLTSENLRRVEAIKVTKANGFKKIELIMKDTPKALPLEEK